MRSRDRFPGHGAHFLSPSAGLRLLEAKTPLVWRYTLTVKGV